MANKVLVAVGPRNYVNPQLNFQVVKRGDKVSVGPEMADHLMSLTYTDRANNPQPMFVEPSHPAAKKLLGEEEEAPKPKRGGRRRTAK